MLSTRNTFRRLSRRVGVLDARDRRPSKLSDLQHLWYDFDSSAKEFETVDVRIAKRCRGSSSKEFISQVQLEEERLEKQTLPFWADGTSRDISIIMSLPTEFTKKGWDTTISWIWGSSVTIWGSLRDVDAHDGPAWTGSADKSVLSSFWKYAASESQSMIFLQLEDKIDSSHQERRTSERGASASANAKTDKEETGDCHQLTLKGWCCRRHFRSFRHDLRRSGRSPDRGIGKSIEKHWILVICVRSYPGETGTSTSRKERKPTCFDFKERSMQ